MWNRCYSYRKTVSKIETKYWFRICDWSRLLLTLYPSHVFVYLKHVSAPEIKFSHCAKTSSVQRGIKWGVRKYLVFRQPKGWKKNRNKEIFLTYPTHWQYEIYHKRHGLNCGWHKSLLFPGADQKCDFKAHWSFCHMWLTNLNQLSGIHLQVD